MLFALLRGLLAKRRFDECGSLLQVTGRLRLFKRRGRIEIGERVFLWPDVKLSVRGDAYPARLVIGDRTSLGDRTEIHCGRAVTIGAGCLLAWDVVVMDRDYHRLDSATEVCEPVCIGDHVWLGARAMILKGVTIGDGAVVAAGSVVVSDVPAGALVAGNPARVVRAKVTWTP
jgi:acetyltransferase-like isoleucine patch superfamily enzyme